MTNLREKKMGFIGAGIMGGIFIEKFLTSRAIMPSHILAGEIRPERRKELERKYSIKTTEDNREVARFADIIFIAVMSKIVREVLDQIAPIVKPGQIVVSLAAAIPLNYIEEVLGKDIPVVRVIPNTPSLIGEGINPVSFGKYVTDEVKDLINQILLPLGKRVVIPDEKMNIYAALTAMGPTYVFPVIDALAQAASEHGLSREEALWAFSQNVVGSAKMVLETEKEPGELKDMIGSQPLKEREEEVKKIFKEALADGYQKLNSAQKKLTEK